MKAVLLLNCLLLAISVFANGLPPILGLPIFHFFILNVFIGWSESIIVQKIFKIPNGPGKIIFGNYVSFIVGLFIAFFILDGIFFDFYGDQAKFFTSILLFVGISTLTEMPFFFWAYQIDVTSGKGWKAAVVANLITNAVIVLIYYLAALA